MHPLDKFRYCPCCGSSRFLASSEKSKKCGDCGFEYFLNPSAANVAFIIDRDNRLLVATRKDEPAKGTFDLPGGFADIGETAEEGVIREVKEETGLIVREATYLFSRPNNYTYSGFEVKTLDAFYLCKVENTADARALDDAEKLQWIAIDALRPEQFGLRSISEGVSRLIKEHKKAVE